MGYCKRGTPGGRFNIKMSSYQYRQSHCGGHTVLWLSDFHSGIFCLSSIGNPIVEIRQSYDCLISTMVFPVLVRQYLDIESGPRQDIRRVVMALLLNPSRCLWKKTNMLWQVERHMHIYIYTIFLFEWADAKIISYPLFANIDTRIYAHHNTVCSWRPNVAKCSWRPNAGVKCG